MSDQVRCRDPRRRDELRRRWRQGRPGPGENERWPAGLDDLAVGEDGRTLTVWLVGKAPAGLTERNVRIEGGHRIRDVRVVDLQVHGSPDPWRADRLTVELDREGDFAAYTLRMVRGDGPPAPHPAFDSRLDRLEFRFRGDCPNPLDCLPRPAGAAIGPDRPVISYLAKDYAGFRQLVLDRLAVVMPEWRERHTADLGIMLVELLAYLGDELSYFQDAVAAEAYLATARRRTSVRRHARLVDYRMHEGCNARTWVCLTTEEDQELIPDDVFFVTARPGHARTDRILREDDLRARPDRYEVFEPLVRRPRVPLTLRRAHNGIRFHTWGDRQCSLSPGATSATLLDGWVWPAAGGEPTRALSLCPGDVLLFEEVRGGITGPPVDADPARRHAVRLTRVQPAEDRTRRDRGRGIAVLDIEWAAEDALPFPLRLSALDPACRLIEDITLARGNVVLADHGRTLAGPEELDEVGRLRTPPCCAGEGRPVQTAVTSAPFRPRLGRGPLTFRQRLPDEAPERWAGAAALIRQDPQRADAQVWAGTRQVRPRRLEPVWTARGDLLDSGPEDRHFAVDIDDERRTELRFGDGRLGRRPDVGDRFSAVYRVGNGRAGNVGADAIAHVVRRHATAVIGAGIRARNPLAAVGGTEPESTAEVKLLAPHQFRHTLERAVTTADYEQLARTVPGVQRAAATMRRASGWSEVRIAVDATGVAEPPPELLAEVDRHLRRYRRLGHELRVVPPDLVPVDVALTVCVLPGVLSAEVHAELADVLSDRELPGGRKGFFHPDNLGFGVGIQLSSLVAAARVVPGVESVTVTALERYGEGAAGELEQGILALGPLEVARVDSDPSRPEHGTVTLTLRGGR